MIEYKVEHKIWYKSFVFVSYYLTSFFFFLILSTSILPLKSLLLVAWAGLMWSCGAWSQAIQLLYKTWTHNLVSENSGWKEKFIDLYKYLNPRQYPWAIAPGPKVQAWLQYKVWTLNKHDKFLFILVVMWLILNK